MYNPALFRVADPARLHDVVEAYPFGMLVAPAPDGLEVAHVPFVLDRGAGPHGTLRFHVARANPVWRAALAAREVLIVFRGPDAYVSASWYEKPHEEVPTWNYAVVHAHGRAAGPMTKDELRRLLADIAARHETGEDAWRIDRLDPAFVDELLGQIVGVSVEIARLDGKFKLSQNRSDEDRRRVRDALALRATEPDLAMLRLMR
jgi:transcriptional regulator